jgi:predicted transcriptional regulator
MTDNVLIDRTAAVVAAFVGRQNVTPEQLPGLITETFRVFASLGNDPEPVAPEPAVDPRKAVKRDSIACLECGTRHKMLKRHLNASHGLTPDEYRAKWDLPASYAMVAADYAEVRRELALKIGLGRGSHNRGRKAKGRGR